jgi:RimJ/RimL family protein N-acetyltransferase
MDIQMRDVCLGDLDCLLAWRNEPAVRFYSIKPAVISKDEHTEWFLKRIELLQDQPFWIFEFDSEKVGMVRLDRNKTGQGFLINIIISPKFRGKGFGKVILNSAIMQMIDAYGAQELTAMVHKENLNSIKLFSSLCFTQVSEKQNYCTFKLYNSSDNDFTINS